MMAEFSYFFWLGALSLLSLSFQDIFNNKIIDDRKNYFMLGVAITLYRYIQSNKLLFMVIIIISTLIFNYLYKSLLEAGDLSAIRWIFMGLSCCSFIYSAMFIIAFSLVYLILLVYLKLLKVPAANIPFMPILLGIFLFVGVYVNGFGF